MPSLNRVILIGRLTRDPELRYTSSGLAVTSFSIAVDRRSKNEQGERQTDFFRCTAWRQQAEFVQQYIHKGRLVAVEGRIEINEYNAQDGQRRTAVDIVCDSIQTLESPRDGVGGGEGGAEGGFQARPGGGAGGNGGGGGNAGGGEYFDDEVGAAPARSQAPQGGGQRPQAAARPQGQGAPQGAPRSQGAPQGASQGEAPAARPQGAPQGGAAAGAPARGGAAQPAYPQNDYDFDDSDPFADE